MRFFSALFLGFFFMINTGWENDFEQAQQKALAENKFILLNFSGSDWCIPCIRIKKEIFETESFKSFADNNLVLVNADFPRLKKNQLSKDQQQKNNKLADRYNSQGSFPLTLLLSADGKIVKQWEGFPEISTEQFLVQIKNILDAGK